MSRLFPALVVAAQFVAALPADGTAAMDPPADVVPAERVILISIDTLRADHLGTYGYPRPTSPALDEFATQGVVFENAMAQAPYTLPSHMSILTGLEVWAHGVRRGDTPLPEAYTTLAETLKAEGWSTAAWVDGGFMSARYGFAQGFDEYHDKREPGHAFENGFRRYAGEVREWLDEQGDAPFFLFLHTFDTHGPYQAEPEHFAALDGTTPIVPPHADRFGDPMEYLRRFGYHDYLQLERFESLDEMVDAYDAAIHFVDSSLAVLFRILEESDRYDDALIIVTSDHGESFMDHQLYVGHGLSLYDEEIHVPLLVKFPGGRFAGTRCGDVVRSIDIFPTVTNSAGAVCPSLVQGIDLVGAIEGTDQEPRIAAGVSPNFAAPGFDVVDGVTGYIRRADVKLIEPPACGLGEVVASYLDREAGHDGGDPYDLDADRLSMKERLPDVPALFDLASDPGETVNLADARRRDVARIMRRMHRDRERDFQLAKVLGAGASADVLFDSEQQLEDLFSQGYLSSGQLRRLKAELELKRRNDAPPKEDG